jgi:GTP-binding protein HflX
MSSADVIPSKRVGMAVYIVNPEIVGHAATQNASFRTMEQKIEEIEGLTEAIQLQILKTNAFKLSQIQPGHFIGKGKRDEITADIEILNPDVVVVNHTLTPVQQRNLEKAWNVKVIDRTGLILEIFGARAQTREGRLQVDLAALEYQKSRIVKSWSHLERQRGGGGFTGGPGEKQVELDRRMIAEKIVRLKRDLEEVRHRRELGRKNRARVPFPVVALVGYTNAGKSTFFNALTKAGVLAEDLLFATLDPTMRRITLPGGQVAILSDTVGFIADLPTDLIAAFRATLEQTLHAHVILHMIDASCADFEAQRADVIQILKDLGIETDKDERIIEIYNKIDAISSDKRDEILRDVHFSDQSCAISALSGQGIDEALNKIARLLSKDRMRLRFSIRPEDGKALSWLYSHAQMLDRMDMDTGISVMVLIDPVDVERFKSVFRYDPL